LVLRVLVSQVGKRIDGVAGPWHAKLHIRSPKLKIIFDSKLHHPKAVMLMSQRFLPLERILWADHKPNLVQATPLKECLGNDQVPEVDGVETSEIEADLHL
jgi:hypothetical protein